MKNNKIVLIVLIPVFLQVGIFIILPIVGGFIISFMDYNPLREDNTFIMFDNYRILFSDAAFLQALTNTLLFVLITVTANMILSLTLAQLITTFRSNKTRSFFRMVFFLPCIAPMVATSVVWARSIYSVRNGLLNIFFNLFGSLGANWLGDPHTILGSIIIFTLWADIGYNIILFSAGLDGIPAEFYEACKIDGANSFQRFFRITLPLLGRTFAFVIIMTLISHFNMFAQFSEMVAKSSPQNAGLVLTSYIYKTAFEYKNLGYASAISMALFAIIMIITLVQQRLNRVDWEY
ncbi:sugar ABC transporter permease [Kineothrix sedimenti]|uniref:Sugar ABC transporter permease n=1 Tax=Kineothrix sedimenti TaxID=3123317 RepID=A0ABZ3F0T3_9FIRM